MQGVWWKYPEDIKQATGSRSWLVASVRKPVDSHWHHPHPCSHFSRSPLFIHWTAVMTFKVATLSLSSSALKIKKGDISQWFVDGFSDAIVIALHSLYLFLYHISGFFPLFWKISCVKNLLKLHWNMFVVENLGH